MTRTHYSRSLLPLAALAVLVVLAACSVTPPAPPASQQPVPRPVPPPVQPPVQLPPPPPPELRLQAETWKQLPGWSADKPAQAWTALLGSCASNRLGDAWRDVCARARALEKVNDKAARKFLEAELVPHRIVFYPGGAGTTGAETGLITGYYEPVLRGARTRGGEFQTPLYGVPDDLLTIDLGDLYPALKGERLRGQLKGKRVVPYPDRAQLADGRQLAGRELAWVEDPVDAFFLQIQGSGRIRLTDGSTVRLAFADVNGQPYRSIGRWLVDQGELTLDQASAQGLKAWIRKNPERKDELLNQNPSVVFFREEKITDPSLGPRGALNVPLTAGRSVAIDPRWMPLGAPMYLSTSQPGYDGRPGSLPLQRLVVAQDTGGAIRGGIRADLFFGVGNEAGNLAGRMRAPGQMWLLWPRGAVPPRPAASTGVAVAN
jgi:membrane-bound lytic murein transglycosylase A